MTQVSEKTEAAEYLQELQAERLASESLQCAHDLLGGIPSKKCEAGELGLTFQKAYEGLVALEQRKTATASSAQQQVVRIPYEPRSKW